MAHGRRCCRVQLSICIRVACDGGIMMHSIILLFMADGMAIFSYGSFLRKCGGVAACGIAKSFRSRGMGWCKSCEYCVHS